MSYRRDSSITKRMKYGVITNSNTHSDTNYNNNAIDQTIDSPSSSVSSESTSLSSSPLLSLLASSMRRYDSGNEVAAKKNSTAALGRGRAHSNNGSLNRSTNGSTDVHRRLHCHHRHIDDNTDSDDTSGDDDDREPNTVERTRRHTNNKDSVTDTRSRDHWNNNKCNSSDDSSGSGNESDKPFQGMTHLADMASAVSPSSSSTTSPNKLSMSSSATTIRRPARSADSRKRNRQHDDTSGVSGADKASLRRHSGLPYSGAAAGQTVLLLPQVRKTFTFMLNAELLQSLSDARHSPATNKKVAVRVRFFGPVPLYVSVKDLLLLYGKRHNTIKRALDGLRIPVEHNALLRETKNGVPKGQLMGVVTREGIHFILNTLRNMPIMKQSHWQNIEAVESVMLRHWLPSIDRFIQRDYDTCTSHTNSTSMSSTTDYQANDPLKGATSTTTSSSHSRCSHGSIIAAGTCYQMTARNTRIEDEHDGADDGVAAVAATPPINGARLRPRQVSHRRRKQTNNNNASKKDGSTQRDVGYSIVISRDDSDDTGNTARESLTTNMSGCDGRQLSDVSSASASSPSLAASPSGSPSRRTQVQATDLVGTRNDSNNLAFGTTKIPSTNKSHQYRSTHILYHDATASGLNGTSVRQTHHLQGDAMLANGVGHTLVAPVPALTLPNPLSIADVSFVNGHLFNARNGSGHPSIPTTSMYDTAAAAVAAAAAMSSYSPLLPNALAPSWILAQQQFMHAQLLATSQVQQAQQAAQWWDNNHGGMMAAMVGAGVMSSTQTPSPYNPPTFGRLGAAITHNHYAGNNGHIGHHGTSPLSTLLSSPVVPPSSSVSMRHIMQHITNMQQSPTSL